MSAIVTLDNSPPSYPILGVLSFTVICISSAVPSSITPIRIALDTETFESLISSTASVTSPASSSSNETVNVM